MRRARAVATSLLVAMAVAGWPALAHQSSLAYSEVIVDGGDIDYTIQIANTDLYEAIGIDKDRPVSRDEVLAAKPRLMEYLAARVHVEEHGAPCTVAPGGLEFVDKAEGFFASARLRFHCPRAIEAALIRYDLFFDLDPRHQGIVRIAFGDEEGREGVFRDGARTLEVRRELTAWDHARQYLRLGVEHIFTGYDHIAFLFGLLVIAGAHGLRAGGRKILGVVTAFTIAHSVTLIASALGSSLLLPLRVVPAIALALATQLTVEDRWFARSRPVARLARVALVALAGYFASTAALQHFPSLRVDPSRVIESSIALSIVYVGVENLVAAAPAHRFLLTFCFGLIHGFGFASVLREIGLPDKGLLLSLVSFNVGVEIGQLGVVAAVLPLLALVSRDRRRASPGGDSRGGSKGPSEGPFPGDRRRPLALELSILVVVALSTFALFLRFGVPALPLGAITFVGAPLLYGLGRRAGYDRVVRIGGSAVVAALAAFWFLERVTGRTVLSGWLG